MELQTALKVFGRLEECRHEPDEDDPPSYQPPVYDVRLEASSSRSDERQFRVFATFGVANLSEQDWRLVLDQAQEFDLSVMLTDAGMELG